MFPRTCQNPYEHHFCEKNFSHIMEKELKTKVLLSCRNHKVEDITVHFSLPLRLCWSENFQRNAGRKGFSAEGVTVYTVLMSKCDSPTKVKAVKVKLLL